MAWWKDLIRCWRTSCRNLLQKREKTGTNGYPLCYLLIAVVLNPVNMLLLLTTSTKKLLAKWQGPYIVVWRKGLANLTYHVNLLKEWREPPSKMMKLVWNTPGMEGGRSWGWETRTRGKSTYASAVDLDTKMAELWHLLDQFLALFLLRPEQTELTQHTINLTDPTWSRQWPYQVPETLMDPLKEEIRTIKELGVIEPSVSEWSRPLVNVPKKDRIPCVCINFHKLNAQLKG